MSSSGLLTSYRIVNISLTSLIEMACWLLYKSEFRGSQSLPKHELESFGLVVEHPDPGSSPGGFLFFA
jgi:hypothetical protein